MPRDDEITPLRSTGGFPLWREAANELARDLEPFCTGPHAEQALNYRERALEALDAFERWSPSNRPDDETRSLVIAGFLTLNRLARDRMVEWRNG